MLPPFLRGMLVGLLLACSTVLTFALMIPPALAKLVIKEGRGRVLIDAILNGLASAWVAINNAWLRAGGAASWPEPEVPPLHEKGWYLVISNHSTWVDILVLQRLFHGRIPFLKFFLKQELIWVPVIGLAWWALDFPFMKRGKGRAAHQSDIEATRDACRKFERIPTTVMNFLEGTRYSAARARSQGSPYRHLLKPRTGGLSIALASLGQRFESVVDVTIAYPDGTPRFWDLMCGRVTQVVVEVEILPVPDVTSGQSGRAAINRAAVADWVESRWLAKDEKLERILTSSGQAAAGSRRAA